ncbi:MAG: hypothetical protein JSW06_01465 [Thermoplasmatales archaeon]|nr:MAG: hypothetical protein JSW06_01465 [Thermoplasmatales archaeon]
MKKSKFGACITIIIGVIVVFGAFISIVEAADTTLVNIDPSSQIGSTDSNFSVNVSCVPGQPIKAFEFKLSFNASLLQVNSVIEGDIFSGYETYFNSGTIYNTAGAVVDVYGLIEGLGNVTGNGTLVSINLIAKNVEGTSALGLYDVGITNETAYVSISVNNGTIEVVITSPQISNVVNIPSDPLDTHSSFGWINITCDVTDNIAVDEVFLNLTNPDGSYNNVSMSGVNSYFYNSSIAFSTYGNYSYFIWANDTSGNVGISSSYDFSMPPNWDVDMNGECNVYDLTLLSNHYEEIGDAGWIREDVDNNGKVEILDFDFVLNHYNESWWS